MAKSKQFLTGKVKSVQKGKISGAVASTGSPDRDGDVVNPQGWELENFKTNPILLWSHDAMSLPIGKVTNIMPMGNELIFDAVFAMRNPFAKMVSDLMEGGFLNTFSVSFIPQDIDQDGQINKAELLEVSVVNVPANAEARVSRQYKSFLEEEKKIAKKYVPDEESDHKEEEKVIEKVGRTISETNRKVLLNAVDSLNSAASVLKDLLEASTPKEDDKKSVKTEDVKVEPVKRVSQEKADASRAMKIALRAVEIARHKLKVN